MAKKRASGKKRTNGKDKDYVISNSRSDWEGRTIARNPYTQPNVSNPAVLRQFGEAKVEGENPYTVYRYPTGMDTRNTFGEKPSGKPLFTRKDVLKDIAKKSQKDAQRRTNLKKNK